MIGTQNVCVPFGNTIMFGLPNGCVLDHEKNTAAHHFLEPSWLHTFSVTRPGRSAKLGTLRFETYVPICFWQLLLLNKQFVKRDWLTHECTLLAWFGQR